MSTHEEGATIAIQPRPMNGRPIAAVLTSMLWATAVFQFAAGDAARGAWLAVASIALMPAALCILLLTLRRPRSLPSALDVEVMCWESSAHGGRRPAAATEKGVSWSARSVGSVSRDGRLGCGWAKLPDSP